jgi:predicted lipoprotein with Yx(FWY)xxD motif
MIRTPLLATVLLAASAATLAACGSSSSTATAPPPPASTAPAADTGSGAGAGGSGSLSTTTSSLGKIVVDGTGMTVYVYDMDTKGTTASACTGACLSLWPPVEVTGTPQVSGVSGTVATITAPDGGKQLTIDGWPIYTYASDKAAGDVNGQGVGGVWWAVSPDGSKITGSGGSTGSTGTTGTTGSTGSGSTGGGGGW